MSTQLDALTHINLNDLVSSFGWENRQFLSTLLRKTFIGPARKFAMQVMDFDHELGQTNIAEASRRLLRKYYVSDVRVNGRENIPVTGPTLFLSNHPGMADTLSLFAAIGRIDLKIIALQRPFLTHLKNTTSRLFFIDEDPARRMNAVRLVSNHLRSGGSVLTFPAGEIEPDPDVYPGALDSLQTWIDSAGVFLRFVRDAKIVPVLVSGVVWQRAAHHWIPRFKRTRFEREKLAAALQLLVMITRNARPTIAHVRFARPITLDEVASLDSQVIHRTIIERMHGLLAAPHETGVSALYPNTTALPELSNNPLIETV